MLLLSLAPLGRTYFLTVAQTNLHSPALVQAKGHIETRGRTQSSCTHCGSHPADSRRLGGSWSELFESQRWTFGWEKVVLKQPPSLEALSFQRLKVLAMKLDSVVVLPQTVITIPLVPQLGSHTCGINGLHHLELLRLTLRGHWQLFRTTIRCGKCKFSTRQLWAIVVLV